MLAKLTSKNQITIPKNIMKHLPSVDYFDVELQNGMITLRPVQVSGTYTEAIRTKMKRLGLTEDSVVDAVRWAREKR